MEMGAGAGMRKAVSTINVTPLIDVLLVLLIIFMVIVPVTPTGLSSQIPQPPKSKTSSSKDVIVLQVTAGSNGEPSYLINESPIAKPEIVPRLESIFSARQDKVMFVKGNPNATYANVAEVIDMAHQADVNQIGLITVKVQAEQ
jgi:biopolymer transport protein TolR